MVSLLGLLVSLVYTCGMSDGAAVMGAIGVVMYAVVLAAALFFVWYSRMMTGKGVLR